MHRTLTVLTAVSFRSRLLFCFYNSERPFLSKAFCHTCLAKFGVSSCATKIGRRTGALSNLNYAVAINERHGASRRCCGETAASAVALAAGRDSGQTPDNLGPGAEG